MASRTVVVQIGNSDDKLTQAEWAEYVLVMSEAVKQNAVQVHFAGFSPTDSRWQNACWVFELNRPTTRQLREQLAHVARLFKQDSVALTVGKTEFVTP